ncbi:hypothetical protein [Tsuneonella dongtanensis]|nr:hypothetical protein [Tsuneonella dongtanensis]
MMKLGLAALGAAALVVSVPAFAQDDPYPLVGGDYVEVTGIELSDGAALRYAQWLAGEWRANEDFFVAQGWNTRYELLTNEFPRKGEPDIYIVRYFPKFIDNAEGEKRRKIMMERYKRTEQKLQEESAGRATYRTVGGSMLLRKQEWKK